MTLTPVVGSQWKQFPQSSELCRQIAAALHIHPIIAQICLNRGFRSADQIRLFLNPSDPDCSGATLDIHELKVASECLLSHIQAQSPILVYGDYDADGVTSVSMMVQALRDAGAVVSYYIPDRFNEGYGLGLFILEVLKARQSRCLITLDCGISNFAEISAIKAELDIDVIILDHHIEPDQRPPATAILNPKHLAPTHAAYYLCTAGICYKWISYLVQQHQFPVDPSHYLDLAAIGTIADIAPLIGENRNLTKAGLEAMGTTTRAGLRHLFRLADRSTQQVTVRDIGFSIAPRINAAGRLTHAKLGVEVLLAPEQTAESLAETLSDLNKKRQEIGQLMIEDAIRQLEDHPELAQYPVIALASDAWHSGVIGIAAAQLARRFAKPTVLISIRDGVGRGSARSFGKVDIYALLKQCESLFSSFGGHKEAAGFSVPFQSISDLLETVRQHADQMIDPSDLQDTLVIDASLQASDMTIDLAEALTRLSPHGPRNEAPIFYTNQLRAIDFRPVGNGEHLKVTFSDQAGQMSIDGIGFGLAKKRNLLQKPFPELAFMLEINEWQNRKRVQLHLVDIR